MKNILFIGIMGLFIISNAMYCGGKKSNESDASDEPEVKFEWTKTLQLEKIPLKPISGTVKGKEYKDVFVQFDEEVKETMVYITTKKPDNPCKSLDFFVENEQIVLALEGRIKPGTYSSAIDKGLELEVFYSVTTPENKTEIESKYIPATYLLKIESANGKEVKGVMAVCLDDSDKSYVAGAFTASYCETRYKALEEAPVINGVTWRMEPYQESDIPSDPIKGNFIGSPYDIQQVQVNETDEGFTIELANKKSNESCGYLSDADEFQIDAKFPLATGTFIANSSNNEDTEKFHVWFSYPMNYDRGPMSYNPIWNLALIIDQIDNTNNLVTGKVIVTCADDAKTMVAGAFEATYCPK